MILIYDHTKSDTFMIDQT